MYVALTYIKVVFHISALSTCLQRVVQTTRLQECALIGPATGGAGGEEPADRAAGSAAPVASEGPVAASAAGLAPVGAAAARAGLEGRGRGGYWARRPTRPAGTS